MRVNWSARALEDRRAIFDYIEADDPRAAILVDDRIEAAIWRLEEFPHSGRPGRVEATLELVVARTPYIPAYSVLEQEVLVLRVIHGARIWPETMSS